MAKVLNVMLKKGLSDKARDATIAGIRKLSGVFNVEALDDTAKTPNIRRMYFATLESSAAEDTVLESIKRMKNVESVSKPAPRYLR